MTKNDKPKGSGSAYDIFVKFLKDCTETPLLGVVTLAVIAFVIFIIRWILVSFARIITDIVNGIFGLATEYWYIIIIAFIIAGIIFLMNKRKASRRSKRTLPKGKGYGLPSGPVTGSVGQRYQPKTKYRTYFWQIWLPKKSRVDYRNRR